MYPDVLLTMFPVAQPYSLASCFVASNAGETRIGSSLLLTQVTDASGITEPPADSNNCRSSGIRFAAYMALTLTNRCAGFPGLAPSSLILVRDALISLISP